MNDIPQTSPPAWRQYFSYLVVALMPLSIDVQKMGDKEPSYRSPLDVLLPILAILLVIDILQRKAWVKFKLPPISSMLWAALALLSFLWIPAEENKAAMKAWAVAALNPIFFAVVAVWVFQNIADDLREYRRLLLILGASFGVCVLIAIKQYFGPTGIPFDPENKTQALGGTTDIRLGGWYDVRYMFGTHAAMIVPAATAFALIEKNPLVRWLAAIVAGLTLCVTLAAGGFVAACAGVVAVAALYAISQRPLTGVTVIAALACLLIVVLPRLPRKNDAVIARGLALYADDEKGEKKPTARLRRYQAALDLLSSPSKGEGSAPLWTKGVGAGRYQGKINQFYQPPYSKPARRTDDEAAYDMEADERFSFGQLETVTVELGICGLLAVLFMYGTWIFSAQFAFSRIDPRRPDSDVAAAISLAAFGAGVGALVISVFSNPLIRGVGGSFALFMAAALVVHRASLQKNVSNSSVSV